MSICEVCGGEGRYPVIDRHGRELYAIRCPECFGTGDLVPDEALDQAIQGRLQAAKYQQAMREKRGASE